MTVVCHALGFVPFSHRLGEFLTCSCTFISMDVEHSRGEEELGSLLVPEVSLYMG